MEMNVKTRFELSRLALALSERDISFEPFSNVLKVAKEIGLNISYVPIRDHRKWLELKVESLKAEKQMVKEVKKWYDGVSDEDILKRSVEIILEMLKKTNKIGVKETTFPSPYVPYVPTYSFFVHGEDGIIYLKGCHKGRCVGEVDAVQWPGSEVKYAIWLLANDKDLTADDKVILNDIVNNRIK